MIFLFCFSKIIEQQLLHNNVDRAAKSQVVTCRAILPLPRATNFHVVESKRRFYFATRKFVACGGGNSCNKQSQNLLHGKLRGNVFRITWP